MPTPETTGAPDALRVELLTNAAETLWVAVLLQNPRTSMISSGLEPTAKRALEVLRQEIKDRVRPIFRVQSEAAVDAAYTALAAEQEKTSHAQQ